jgi:cell division protein FtsQ
MVDSAPRDSGLEKQRLAVALDVLNHYSQSKLFRTHPPEEVHLTPGGEIILTVGHKGTAVYLGVGPWSKKFALAERIFAKLQGQRSTPSLVFLDNRAHPERVVVRVN